MNRPSRSNDLITKKRSDLEGTFTSPAHHVCTFDSHTTPHHATTPVLPSDKLHLPTYLLPTSYNPSPRTGYRTHGHHVQAANPHTLTLLAHMSKEFITSHRHSSIHLGTNECSQSLWTQLRTLVRNPTLAVIIRCVVIDTVKPTSSEAPDPDDKLA